MYLIEDGLLVAESERVKQAHSSHKGCNEEDSRAEVAPLSKDGIQLELGMS